MPDRYSPTVRKRVLGIELRKLRKAASMTGDEAAAEMGINQSHLSQMENAKRGISKAQLRAFLSIYKADDKTRDQLLLLHSTLKQPAWWRGMGVPSGSYVDLEAAADEIRTFDLGLIFGLLQTEDYAAEIIRSTTPGVSDKDVTQRVSVRRERAELLDDGLKLRAILDEAAIRRQVGGSAVMAAQLDYLVKRVRALPNLTVQVISFADGGHISMEQSFAVLTYTDHPSLGYTERWGDGAWLESGNDVDEAMKRWERLSSTALKARKSIELIRHVAEEMRE